jgi:hypothetical protein
MTSRAVIAVVGVLYALTVVALIHERNYWKALVFAGYTLAQIGIFFI